MPGFLSSVYDSVTRRIDLDEHYWIELRLLKTREVVAISEQVGSKAEQAAIAMATAIVRWNLDDEEGQVMALPPDSSFIMEWPQSMYAKVAEAMAKLEGAGDSSFRREAVLVNHPGQLDGSPADSPAVLDGASVLEPTGAPRPGSI